MTEDVSARWRPVRSAVSLRSPDSAPRFPRPLQSELPKRCRPRRRYVGLSDAAARAQRREANDSSDRHTSPLRVVWRSSTARQPYHGPLRPAARAAALTPAQSMTCAAAARRVVHSVPGDARCLVVDQRTDDARTREGMLCFPFEPCRRPSAPEPAAAVSLRLHPSRMETWTGSDPRGVGGGV